MKVTNKYGLPQALVNAVGLTQHNKEGCYSATTILHGTREILLTKRHWDDIEVDVADSIWTIFGSAVHAIMEKQNDDSFKEEPFEIPISNSKLTGQVDSYDLENEVLVDWKTASVWKVKMNDFKDWRRQGLIYAYLLKKNGLGVKHCRFVAMLKDHSKTNAKREADYPLHPVLVYEFDVTENDLKKAGEFVERRIKEIEDNLNTPDDELPLCSKEERWASDDKFAVMKKGNKRAVRVFDDEENANLLVKTSPDYYIEKRPAVSRKCEDYCMCREFCSYYKSMKK